MYPDFSDKHAYINQNKAWYPYTISWELYGDNNIQLKIMVEIDILRNSSQIFLGVLRGAF